jgi:Flp pilus assembly protein TadG
LLWVGLGCGGLLLLGVGGGIAGYLYMRSQVSGAESAIAAAASAVAAGDSSATAPSTLTPSCAKAVACCKATMAKTAGANAAAGEQACNGIGLLSEDVCEKQYEGQKRAATVVGAICP